LFNEGLESGEGDKGKEGVARFFVAHAKTSVFLAFSAALFDTSAQPV
jgi:hypothetical protein